MADWYQRKIMGVIKSPSIGLIVCKCIAWS